MCLNHPKPSLSTPVCGKTVFTKPLPGAKKVGDHSWKMDEPRPRRGGLQEKDYIIPPANF